MKLAVALFLSTMSLAVVADEPSVARECKENLKTYTLAGGTRFDSCPDDTGDLKLDIVSVGANYHMCWWHTTAKADGGIYTAKGSDCEVSFHIDGRVLDAKFVGACRYDCGARASFRSGIYTEKTAGKQKQHAEANSHAFANSGLFHIDAKRAVAIAEGVVRDTKPEIFSKGLKLKEIKHEFDVPGDPKSKQMLKITFLYSEVKLAKLSDTLIVSVVLDEKGAVLGRSTGRAMATLPRQNTVLPKNAIQACRDAELHHSEMLSVPEYCKYTTEACPLAGQPNEKVRAICAENSLAACFEKKKWVSMSQYFGLAPNLEIIRVEQKAASTQACGWFHKV